MRKISEFQEEIKIKREYLQGMLSRQTKCDNVRRPGIVDVHVLMDTLVEPKPSDMQCSKKIFLFCESNSIKLILQNERGVM